MKLKLWMFTKRPKVVDSFRADSICPLIKVNLLGKNVYLLFDSGSDTCYIDKEFFDSVGFTGKIEASKGVVGHSGEMQTFGQIKTAVSIRQTNYELPMTIYPLKDRLAIFDNGSGIPTVGIIGGNFMFVYHMSLDYHKKQLLEYR